MSDPHWYANWRYQAVRILQARNQTLQEQFQLGSWPSYNYDLATRGLTFSENDKVRIIADIQVVGSTSQNAGNWLWGWANPNWPVDCTDDAKRAYSFGQEHGIKDLVSGYVADDDLNALGWELTAVTAKICDAAGAYRPPRDEDGGLFLLVHNVRWID